MQRTRLTKIVIISVMCLLSACSSETPSEGVDSPPSPQTPITNQLPDLPTFDLSQADPFFDAHKLNEPLHEELLTPPQVVEPPQYVFEGRLKLLNEKNNETM